MRRTSWLIGVLPALGTLVVLIAVGPHVFYGHSDADLFLAVARSPLGDGKHFPADPLVQGVAYRYGRILFPSLGWLLGFGRRPWIAWSLAVVYAASIGAWIAVTAEHLSRGGRSPRLALLVLVLPFSIVWMRLPIVVGEPLAGALVLFTYLSALDGKHRRTVVAAALTILAREALAVAFVPLMWRAYKERGAAGLLQWSLAFVPYSIWSVWVRLRVGHVPFLDPAATRRNALALPFVGWRDVLRQPTNHDPGLGLLVGGATIAVAVVVALSNRGRARSLVVQGALVSCGFIACYGWAVWQYPTEAVRVMAPAQVLLLIAVLTTNAIRTTAPGDVPARPGGNRLPALTSDPGGGFRPAPVCRSTW